MGGGRFDENFVEIANQYDLLIFGGGGFFKLAYNYSSSGTTIDLKEDIFHQIRVPILFNCLNVSVTPETNHEIIERFRLFLEMITQSPDCFVTVRNDGSMEVLNKLYNSGYSDKILKIPDGGFFCRPEDYKNPEIVKGKINIAINLAGDMPENRFGMEGQIGKKEFVSGFSNFCNRLLDTNEDIRLIFVPHIWKDLGFITEVMQGIEDKFLRLRVTCAGCYNGKNTDGLVAFSLYRKCALVIGMRYHANVVPIGCNIPTVMLGTIEPHISLYRDLGIMHRCVEANKEGFDEILYSKVQKILCEPEKIKEENEAIIGRLNKENSIYIEHLIKWMEYV